MISAFLALAAWPGSAVAQESGDEEGRDLMERGAEMLFEGLRQELEPALRELEGAAREMRPKLRSFVLEMGPALGELMDKVEDWSAYEAPEMLPNGDIIMRRKTPLEPGPPGEGEIDI